MTTQQIASGRGGIGWFDFGDTALFAPPKTGFSTLSSNFSANLRGAVLPHSVHSILGSFRDPVSRWLSAYNMFVLWGYKRTDPRRDILIERFGTAWFEHWFPPPESIVDPVGFTRLWLTEAQPQLEAQGAELHLCSQRACYRRLLGDCWEEDPRLQLFPTRLWLTAIYRTTGVMLNRAENTGVYLHPVHYYNTVKPLIRCTFAEDQRIWQSVKLNTI
jgi:hypothetical protein